MELQPHRRQLNYPLREFMERPKWMALGKCGGGGELTALFYPDTNVGEVTRAKDCCWGRKDGRPCPVREQCLEHALVNDEKFGVWGGLSERERRSIQRRKRLAS